MAHLITGNKFDPDKDIPDLSGKVWILRSPNREYPAWYTVAYFLAKSPLIQVYVITGGSAGIGFGITAHLLQHNAARIVILSQKEEHAEEAKQELNKYGDSSKVEWIQLDLKNLKQTDEVAKQLVSEDRIDGVSIKCQRDLG